nr:hypothetical protein [Leifsonia sp. Leaf264]
MPGPVLGSVPELFEGICQESLRLGVVRFCEHDVTDHLGDPAQITVGQRLPCAFEDGGGSAHVAYVPLPCSTGVCCHKWAELPSNHPMYRL